MPRARVLQVRKTAVGVSAVIAQLDAAMSQLNLPSANGTSATSGTGTGASSGTGTAASGSGTGTAPVAGSGSGSRPASGSGSGAGASGGGTSARDRAADLAVELGKALGAFSDVAGNATVAGAPRATQQGVLGWQRVPSWQHGVCAAPRFQRLILALALMRASLPDARPATSRTRAPY